MSGVVMTGASSIPVVVAQHVEELSSLWVMRDGLVDAGHAALRHLARLDDRIAAHQDGCAVAGQAALSVLNEQLGSAPGTLFAAAVSALDLGDRETLMRCLSVAEAAPEFRRELISAVGWVSGTRLTGVVKDMLDGSLTARTVALAACRLHGVNPGAGLRDALTAADPQLRAEALRDVGVLGLTDQAALVAMPQGDEDCQFWAAWSSALLGDRRGLDILAGDSREEGPHRARALALVCQAMPTAAAHDVLRYAATTGGGARLVVRGSGIIGDPVYVPWLIEQMSDEKMARIAGESFSLITGADIGLLDLERSSIGESPAEPTDDADDDAVDDDPDAGLPWPEPTLVRAWWAKREHEFRQGVRYFVGLPVTRDHCTFVLREGTQRQRRLAAYHLSLLAPGTPLFNTGAPAWRQQRLLAQL